VVNSLYCAIKEKVKPIQVLSSSWRNNLIKSTRWFNIYEIADGEYIIVWKYNHLFKSLEPEVLARLYHYYPANLDLFGIQIHSRGCFIGGKHN
jgi:hypothetical protein